MSQMVRSASRRVRGQAQKHMVDRASALAERAHVGQVDKAGEPYISHPQRVAARLTEDSQLAVAWLHDVAEDTDVGLDELRAQFPAAVVDAVEAITRRPGELPDHYYARVRANPIALAVKRADIADNSDPVRLARLDPVTRTRLEGKYAHALAELNRAGV